MRNTLELVATLTGAIALYFLIEKFILPPHEWSLFAHISGGQLMKSIWHMERIAFSLMASAIVVHKVLLIARGMRDGNVSHGLMPEWKDIFKVVFVLGASVAFLLAGYWVIRAIDG